jgi:EAL domain-containing protein (putative c-di-GMP-specific phosphodiesterase class I)
LIVDDDPLVLRSVERILVREGYTVFTASDRESARVLGTENPLSLALVDYTLGREDGLDVMADLRDLQPGCLRVLMTGNRDFPMVVEAINRGEVVRVLRKPFQPKDLNKLVREAFLSAKRQEQRANARLIEGAMAERTTLDECIRRNLMKLAVQPIVDVSTGEALPVAYEALLRPQHPDMRSPLALLDAAERFGRIDDVGTAVLNMAHGWLQDLPVNRGLFINLHPAQLGDPDRLARDIESLKPSAKRITMEITERARMHDIDGWERSVDILTGAGFAIAVDDLGAGYNSLTMLAELSPQYIKLDMSLVRNVHTEPRKQRLVQLLVTFAEATGANTIAEGVETDEEAMVLVDMGIQLMQGYLYARPMMELPEQVS